VLRSFQTKWNHSHSFGSEASPVEIRQDLGGPSLSGALRSCPRQFHLECRGCGRLLVCCYFARNVTKTFVNSELARVFVAETSCNLTKHYVMKLDDYWTTLAGVV